MKLFDLDYFRTKDNTIFIVKGNFHPHEKVFAYPVYWPSEKGERFSADLNLKYKKQIDELFNVKYFSKYPSTRHPYLPQNIPAIDLKEIVEIYHPQKIIKKFKREMKGSIWWKIYRSLEEIAKIDEKNIGIFGSYLVGLGQNDNGRLIKDIDFVIYGADNCQKFKKYQKIIKSSCMLEDINSKHIKYETEKLGRGFNKKRNSIAKMLGNKWSSIQVAPKILTTIRFVDEDFGMLIRHNPNAKTVCLTGKVVDEFWGSFVPRIFSLVSKRTHFKVITYYWIYHQALKKGQKVKVWGYLYNNNLVIIDSIKHGIKIL